MSESEEIPHSYSYSEINTNVHFFLHHQYMEKNNQISGQRNEKHIGYIQEYHRSLSRFGYS